MISLDQVCADLRSDESWRSYVYDDKDSQPLVKGSTIKGYATIGWGFCVDRDKGAPLPREVGDIWLRHLVEERFDGLDRALPWFYRAHEDIQRALTNMAFQMGVGGVLGFKKMIAALANDDRETVSTEALDSLCAREQSPERAKQIASLIRGHD